MSLDGIFIRALVDQLRAKMIDGRVDKIHQPDKNTIILNIRVPQKTCKLLLSAHPQSARFHLTEKSRENPTQPPLFCMVLRKHLEGGKLVDIEQVGFERVVHFTFDAVDELGQRVKRVLIGEFMGKHSNLILINPENKVILDSIKRLGANVNQYRQVLPGNTYTFPPPQNKLAVTLINEEQLVASLLELPPNKSVANGLLNVLSGVGPQTAKELAVRSGLNPSTPLEFLGQYEYSRLWQGISWLKDLISMKNYLPTLIQDEEGRPLAFAPFPLEQYGDASYRSFATMDALVEDAIGQMENTNLLKQRVLDLEKIVNRELERCHKKMALQLEKVAQGETAEKYRIWGELITANLYQLTQGPVAVVNNFYSEEQEMLEIPLDPHLTPNENAQILFKKYNKAKTAKDMAYQQIAAIKEDINYIETIKNSLEKVEDLRDLDEVRLELVEAGYAKAKPLKYKKQNKKEPVTQPLKLEYDGYTIFIGKNNIQNDFVTFKIAKNSDLWFHAKDIPGSHVIVKSPDKKDIPNHIKELAASLAAYYSKSRYSSQVPVDYTLKKDVRKIGGAKPGMVTYDGQKTIYITPDEGKIKEILN